MCALPTDDGETEWWRHGGSKKNRKVTIWLLPLIVIILNIFPLPKLPSSYTTFSTKAVYSYVKVLYWKVLIGQKKVPYETNKG
jgi:hypothetical protein